MNRIKRTNRSPLTRAELKAIQERRGDSADVVALLWEVFRLRALALRTHDYLRQERGTATTAIMENALRRELDEEPVVTEQPKL